MSRFRWLAICLFTAIPCVVVFSMLAVACEDDPPPYATEPSVEHMLRDTAGNPVVFISFDPRGMRQLLGADERGVNWVPVGSGDRAWDYREWHWWKGHKLGDSCRLRYWADVTFTPRTVFPAASSAEHSVRIDYNVDGFNCTQQYLLPKTVRADAAHWDVVVTVKNESAGDVDGYGHLLASYTAPNARGEDGLSHWFWDASGELVKWSDRGVDHLDSFIANPEGYFMADGKIPHMPRGYGKIVGTWHQPVLVSQATPAGWRSIIMMEPAHTAALGQGLGGVAMDYILFPGTRSPEFKSGARFSAHIRHYVILSPDLPSTEQLDRLWSMFENSRAAIQRRATKSRKGP